jgi:NifB/MoaA-like Fe-S oxidoreductase
MAAADGVLWLTVVRDGRPLDLAVEPRPQEWHGVSLAHGGLGDPPRACRNRCRFCFVDQLPAGLRAALSFKDDDYRLSFLHGNFMTLSNLDLHDLERIEALRLQPLYVSLHAWDDAARVRLMGRAARGSRAALQRLAAAGLELHLQVVLCPGWNDGAALAETVEALRALPAVADLGIVPVSLAAEGDLRRVTAADAEALLAAVHEWQARCRTELGRSFVHAADEFHLLCGLLPPASDAPEQYENGIGMSAQLLEEAGSLAATGLHGVQGEGEVGAGAGGRPAGDTPGDVDCTPPDAVRLLCGELAEPVIARAAAALEPATGLHVRPFAVPNRLFGRHVTVTGLLGGEEIVDAMGARPLADREWLVVPRTVVPRGLARTLDDVTEAQLAAACDGRIVLADSLAAAFATLAR